LTTAAAPNGGYAHGYQELSSSPGWLSPSQPVGQLVRLYIYASPRRGERPDLPLMASGYGVPDSARSPVPDVWSAWRAAASRRTRVCTVCRPPRGRGTWSRRA